MTTCFICLRAQGNLHLQMFIQDGDKLRPATDTEIIKADISLLSEERVCEKCREEIEND